jgi:hypothetical protein
MNPTLSPDDFNHLTAILAARPGFANPMGRYAYVTALLQGSPRAAALQGGLPLTMANTRADAVSLVHFLLQFGQDVRGREALTLLVRALLDDMGFGTDADFLIGLFEGYPLESAHAGKPIPLLFMTANPTDTARLRLEVEYREVDDALLKARYRERFTLELRPALRASDVQESLLRYQPGIVHFSGHGAEAGLIFEDDAGKLRLIDPAAVADLFRIVTPKVQIVVLNACWSAAQAEQIAPHVQCVIGMTQPVGDRAAIEFAAAFYRALGYGTSVQAAFDFGVNQIALMGLKSADIPTLLCNPACDPAKTKLI